MGKIISVVSWKGGVGKTTSAVNISAYLQMQGKRVCAIDLDSQHNLSKHFGILPGQLKDRKTVYNLFVAAINECEDAEMDALIHAAIRQTGTVDVIPSTPKLTALEAVLPSATCREQLLQHILSFIKEEYDYIFIDCHPGSDLFTQNALTASDSVILPVEAHVLSSDGLAQEEKMIRSVRRHLNPDLQIEGILITKFQNQTNCCRQVLQSIVDNYGDRVRIFDEPIKYVIKVAEAPAFGISLHEYAPKCEAAKAYSNGNMSIFGMSGAGKEDTAFRGNNQKNRHEKTEHSHKDLKSLMNTRYGADVHNQPKIYIENPAENSHISPYICQLIHFTNYGSRMPKFVGWLPCKILRNSLLLLSYSITSREKIKSAKG